MRYFKIPAFLALAIAGHFLIYFNFYHQDAPTSRQVILVVGAPGSGKGTQATFLSTNLNIPQISSGDLLRAEVAKGTALGKELEEAMKSGQLVPSEHVAKVMKARLEQEDCKNGFILDGFPRRLNEVKMLEDMGIQISSVVEIDVPDEEVKQRITGRLIHQPSGRSYHVRHNPPKKAGHDDVTGEKLVQRADDTIETVTKRLNAFHEQTGPAIHYLKGCDHIQYVKIDGTMQIHAIQQILATRFKIDLA